MTVNWQAYYERKHERGEARAKVMYTMYQSGMTYNAIGQVYGVSESAVQKAIKRWVFDR